MKVLNKDQFIHVLSAKDGFTCFEYNKNIYYMYHENNSTVYGWLTPCGFRRSRVISTGRIPFPVEESSRYLSMYIKSIVKRDFIPT